MSAEEKHAFKKRVIQKVIVITLLLLGLTAYGTIGFYILEGQSLFDSFYMAVITFSTVGFQEVFPLSDEGRLFAITVILLGVTCSGVSLGVISNLVFEETLLNVFKGRRMLKKLKKIKNHAIVCGYGTTGRSIVEELLLQGKSVVVIDQRTDMDFENQDWAFVSGDARHDDVLKLANIQEADGLASTLTEDADNVFVVLTARALNPDLRIVSRYKDEVSERKLIIAGANQVVSPYRMGGHRLAHGLLNPELSKLLDPTLNANSSTAVRLHYLPVPKHSPILGKRIQDADLRSISMGALLVGVMDQQGKLNFNPDQESRLENVSQLVVMGDAEQIAALRNYVENVSDKS